MNQWLDLLPGVYREQLTGDMLEQAEELRLCAGQPLMLRMTGEERMLWPRVRQTQLEELVQVACKHSVYAHTDTLRQGFVTLEGGHRLGICGFGVLGSSGVQSLKAPSSVLLRIAGAHPGCAAALSGQLTGSALILGPPCSGKTTLLRDLIRLLSDHHGQRVGLADERGEVSATVDGIPQLPIGARTDVLVNIPKALAALMLLRTMNPQWIAMDEITAPEDVEAVERCAYCGVKLLTTIHADSPEDLRRRPLYRSLMERGVFQWLIMMHPDKSYAIQEVTA